MNLPFCENDKQLLLVNIIFLLIFVQVVGRIVFTFASFLF